MKRRFALVAILVAAFVLRGDALATAQVETSASVVLLGDIFAPRSTPATPSSDEWSGPLLERPGLDRWRPAPEVLPTPTPELPQDFDFGIIEPLLPRFEEVTGRDEPFFDDAAPRLNPGGIGTRAQLVIGNPFNQLCVRYRIERIGGVPMEPLVLLHAPGSAESFRLEQGRYRIRREVWLPERPEELFIEEWTQTLSRAVDYARRPLRDDEARLRGEIRSVALRRRVRQ